MDVKDGQKYYENNMFYFLLKYYLDIIYFTCILLIAVRDHRSLSTLEVRLGNSGQWP